MVGVEGGAGQSVREGLRALVGLGRAEVWPLGGGNRTPQHQQLSESTHRHVTGDLSAWHTDGPWNGSCQHSGQAPLQGLSVC